MRRYALGLALSLAACVPAKPAQLAPQTLTTPRSPVQATQAAAQVLAADGFDILTSDATGGLVTAKRVRSKTGNSDFLACRYAKGSIAETNMESTITVTVVAKQADAGSSVMITSRTHTAFPALQGSSIAMTPSDDDCASTGLAESHVATAIR